MKDKFDDSIEDKFDDSMGNEFNKNQNLANLVKTTL